MKEDNNPSLIELMLAPTLEEKLWSEALPEHDTTPVDKRVLISPSSIATIVATGQSGNTEIVLKEARYGKNIVYEVLEDYDKIKALINEAYMTEAEKGERDFMNRHRDIPRRQD